jgi:hypothetical protein
MATSSTTSSILLGPPAELRTIIFKLALFHQETGGIIAPAPDNTNRFVTLVSCERFLISGGQPEFRGFPRPLGTAQKALSLDELPDGQCRIWSGSVNARTGHLCTLYCLVQPPIALVNVQICLEALPIFYSVNRIHFEMVNFRLKKEGVVVGPQS